MALVVILAGAVFLLFGLYIRSRHARFVSNCIRTPGTIVDIVEKVYTSKTAAGSTSGIRIIKAPVVEYQQGKTLRFEAEIDVRQHRLQTDDKVVVLVSSDNPKVAKLEIGARETLLLMRMFIGFGTVALALGLFLVDPTDYRMALLEDPLSLGLAAAVGFVLYAKAWPLIGVLRSAPLYVENAVEVRDEDTA